MQYRRLGHSGCRVSAVALGTWLTFGSQLHDNAAAQLLRRAFDLGINFLDTADVYDGGKAETQLGNLLQEVARTDYVLATKCFFPSGDGPNDRGLSRKHVTESVHASLKRLRTEYIDLFQCHRYDEETPVAETVRTFGDLIAQGKILYWGVSCWTGAQIEEAVAACRETGTPLPVSNQPEYNLLDRSIEAEVVPVCRQHGIGTIPYSPLAQGVLTGKYLEGKRPSQSRATDDKRNQFMGRYLEEDALRRVARMKQMADAEGVTCAQLALAWLLHRDTVSSVIVGATRAPQLDENAKAVEVPFTSEQGAILDQMFP